jgi:hypothetical protein
MKSVILLMLLLGIVVPVAKADFATTLDHWKGGDWAVQKISDRAYLDYTDEELSRLIPVIAQWIPIKAELEKSPHDAWKTFKTEHEWTPFLNALPPDHPIRKRWGLGHRAAWVIRVLAENRRLQQESVLPALIEGVAHPCASFTGRDCFYALTALTKLYDGPLTSWGNLDEGERDAVKISEWFVHWYAGNQGKQMIVTPTLEQQIKKQHLAVATRLENLVSEPPHSLHGFRAPDEKDYHKVGAPLFDVQWDGRLLSVPIVRARGEGWVLICARPQTKLIEGVKAWERYPSWDMLKALPQGARRIYQHPIVDTDWALEIYVNRLSNREIAQLSSALEGGPGDTGDK